MQQLLDLAVDRPCLRDAIPEIYDAARYLDAAVSAHLSSDPKLAEELIDKANIPAVREWSESLLNQAGAYVQYRLVSSAPPILDAGLREVLRMPVAAEKRLLHLRDGYHCRFCGIPVIRKEVRDRLRVLYPRVMPWGGSNATQHAAFLAMWAQYDHLLPHARGGKNDFENTVITCAPCNFGRMSYILEEVGLADPRTRPPIVSRWDGLERLLHHSEPTVIPA